MSRAERKIDHIRHALSHERDDLNHFDDMEIVHQSLSDMDYNQLSIAAQVGELSLSSPLFVNAMTGGGGKKTEEINRRLAYAAKKTGIGMAVGSQMAALKNKSERQTYRVVREENPDGILLANVGSEATIDQALKAIEMIDADGIQIHLNTLQELIMPEGDRDFTHRLQNIEEIVKHVDIPVIVKEVGYGLSKETTAQLIECGINYVDVGGRGGTNFSRVENLRREKPFASYNNWGIQTLPSIMELKHTFPDLHIIGSGGIRHGLDGVKTMVLGSQAFAMAGGLLKILVEDGVEALLSEIRQIHNEIKIAMTLLNVEHVSEFYGLPYVLYGKTKERMEQRL